jgi:hypothetical protein
LSVFAPIENESVAMNNSAAIELPESRIWATVLRATQLLILIRVPLVMVYLGVVLTRQLEQISELLDLSLTSEHQLWAAWWFAGILGFLVWYSARTLYAFDWSERIGVSTDWHRVGEYLPRALGALVPLIMAWAYASRQPVNGICGCVWAWLFVAQAILIALITWKRRPMVQALSTWLGRNREAWISSLPDVGKYKRWKELGSPRHWHWAGLAVLIASSLVGWRYPQSIDAIGPVALILGAGAWLVWASTAPIYWAARRKIPLLSLLVIWAIVLNLGGCNDNHAVRLTASMDSVDDPPAGLHYGDEVPARLSMQNYLIEWSEQHPIDQCPRVYLVASEGGGIRAAAWTALVLSKLEERSGGQFWRCTLAASGVSGGSLGLALFSAHLRDNEGKLDPKALQSVFNRDFLAPVLASAFGVDQLQRFLPGRWFTDRGQALESAWIAAYRDHETPAERSFDLPLANMIRARNSDRLLPALFFNSTAISSGTRLIQHPFAPAIVMTANDKALLKPVSPFASTFPGAIDGANWLPAELPLSSAVLNSSRFAYASPAGTVRRLMAEPAKPRTLGQLVDGGYFENSGATTLSDFMRLANKESSDLGNRMAVIHISNDVGVAGVMSRHNMESPQEEGPDTCPAYRPDPEIADDPAPTAATTHGELLSPLLTLYQTREARGDQARRILAQTMAQGPDGNERQTFWHFRLCKGKRAFPLGWTIGRDTLEEMTNQLSGDAEVHARGFPKMSCESVGASCVDMPAK